MIHLICSYQSNRLNYTLDLIFKELLGLDYAVITERNENFCCIEYSDSVSADIPDTGLLNLESIVYPHEADNIGQWAQLPVIFHAKGEYSIPFDIFSAVFFLVSRYEEYLPYTPDAHERFPPEASVLVKHNWIKMPLVNLWVLELKKWLERKFPDLNFNPRKFRYQSTIDIDMAWKYRHKGFYRGTGALLRDISGGYFTRLKERLGMLLGGKKDPYFNFGEQDQWHEEFRTNVIYFILLGEFGAFDKNISPRNACFREFIKDLASRFTTGIHPSYAGFLDNEKVAAEIELLADISGKPVKISRQHFLRMKLPESFEILLENGIREDYTLGYTSYSGFRAGIAADFFWFNLRTNRVTELRLFPFCHMDITPMFYEKKSIPQACEDLSVFMKSVAECGGYFSSLWHNESLSDSERWKGWRELYIHTLKTAQQLSDTRP